MVYIFPNITSVCHERSVSWDETWTGFAYAGPRSWSCHINFTWNIHKTEIILDLRQLLLSAEVWLHMTTVGHGLSTAGLRKRYFWLEFLHWFGSITYSIVKQYVVMYHVTQWALLLLLERRNRAGKTVVNLLSMTIYDTIFSSWSIHHIWYTHSIS